MCARECLLACISVCVAACLLVCMFVCGITLHLFVSGSIFPFDHTHPSSSSSAQATLVLYGVLGSTITRDWHTSIITALTMHKGLLRYVFRHVVPAEEGLTRPTRLQGFGVALDLKNMEYKTLDDRAPAVRATDVAFMCVSVSVIIYRT